ncbi:hypothetical protein [Rhodococcus sp. B10]|uniref:hypothetical protein n=1 Tax=Rhodococcus sp. B10 TaxID=2695876 RepID=UPI00142F531B|nr:hypothetical protein [Rhodococcus sp. B10]NIL77640.1 hypothetical protein [Rhodococcus sp. B10]
MSAGDRVAIAFAALVTLTRITSLLAALWFAVVASWRWDSSYVPTIAALFTAYIASSAVMSLMLWRSGLRGGV